MKYESTNLPVLSISGQHHGVLSLGDLIIVIILSLLDVLLGLDSFVLGESTVVALL
jgi:hypothetical protein